MATRYFCLVLLAVSFLPASALAAATVPPSPAQRRIHITIKNDYEADLNFGPLGKGSRIGIDEVEGVLEWRDGAYAGTVTATVGSTQTLSGLTGNCGPETYRDSQELQVTGYLVTGLNDTVQSVTFNSPANAGSASNLYVLLKFAPIPGNPLRPPNPNPDQDQVINCHTIIETPAGRFLPLNDSRWTMEDGGYIIIVPPAGDLYYTDTTVPSGGAGNPLAPIFNAKKSVWTIEVELLH